MARSRTTCRRAGCTSTTPCPGIILLIAGAFTALAVDVHTGWSIVAGLLVGVGTSLVLDEFALILHLQDVYWSDEGRISVEMVSLAIGCMGLVLVGYGPFEDDTSQGPEVAATVVAVGINLLWIVLCVAKGKYKLALFSIFIPLIGISAPCGWPVRARAGRGTATRRRSGPAPPNGRPATTSRFGPATDWVSDFVAGKPSQPDPPPPSPPTPARPEGATS